VVSDVILGQSSTCISTHVGDLDDLLGGSGLKTSLIYEVYGASGVGKTQLCLFLSSVVASQGKGVLYFDTKNDFSAHRMFQVALAHCASSGSDAKRVKRSADDHEVLALEAMGRVRVAKATTMDALLDLLYSCPLNHDCQSLLVIDNMASVLTPMLDRVNFQKMAAQIKAVKARIHQLIDGHAMTAVVVNNATRAFNPGQAKHATDVKPALGKLFSEFADVRLNVSRVETAQPKTNSTRRIRVEKDFDTGLNSGEAKNTIHLQLASCGYN